MDLVNSQHSDAVAVFGETSPVVVKHLPTIKDELPKTMFLESQFNRWKRRANVRSTLPPRGQIDADVQLRAPRSGFRGPIARPAASVLLISVFMTRTKAALAGARFSGTLAQFCGSFGQELSISVPLTTSHRDGWHERLRQRLWQCGDSRRLDSKALGKNERRCHFLE